MRSLILIALVACANAAPTAPLALGATPLIAVAGIAPTISPGDLEAAAIDAKTAAEDQARSFADQARIAEDQAREQAEIALENQKIELETEKAKSLQLTDDFSTKNEELVASADDQKWLAYDAVNTAQAKLEGSIANAQGAIANLEGNLASNAGILAKSALGTPIILAQAPLVAAINPILYTPGIVAPLTKAVLPAEAASEDNKPVEVGTRSAEELTKAAEELTKKAEEIEGGKQVLLKATDEKPAIPLTGAVLPVGGIALAPAIKYEPWLAPIALVPSALQYSATINHGAVLAAPIVKSW